MAAEASAVNQLHGGKFWEKRRRDRLKDSFSKLARLLPNHDPSKLPSQNDILIKATKFISELRLSNLRLLSDTEDEKSKLIMQLQDEVNKLIVRVKQLTLILRKAKIVIPAGPEISTLGKRPGEKSGSSDAENAKKTKKDCTANPTSDESADDIIEITGNPSDKPALVPVPLRDSNTNTTHKTKKTKSPKKNPQKANLNSGQAHASLATAISGMAMPVTSVSAATSVPLQIPLRTVSLPTFITIPQPCVTILPQQVRVADNNPSQLILPKPLVAATCPRVAIARLANTRPPKKKFRRNRKKKVKTQLTRSDAQIQTHESSALAEVPEKETSSSTDANIHLNTTENTLPARPKTVNMDTLGVPLGTEKSTGNSATESIGASLASSSDKVDARDNTSSLEDLEPTSHVTDAKKHVGSESEINSQQPPTVGSAAQTEGVCDASIIGEKELESISTSPQKAHEFMTDTFNDIEEIFMPHNQKEHMSPTDAAQASVMQSHESAQNDTQQRPQDTEQLSSEKISECIARSMDLIDQSGPDLMDLSGDWPNTSSPKSPLSPTKMFLSMFPLALRENPPVGTSSTPGPEVSSVNSKVTATTSSTAKSSFHIDSMLPAEEMTGRASTCNTPLPMVLPGMIGHQPASLHSLSTDDYLSMVSSFVSGTGTKTSFDAFSMGLTGDLEGTEASNPFSFSLNLPTFEAPTPSEQLTGGNKYIPDQSRNRPDKRSSAALVPNILDSRQQIATPTNFSFTLSNIGSCPAAASSTNLDTESKRKSTTPRNASASDSTHHIDQRHQVSAGASSRHAHQTQAHQRSAKHQSNPMQFTISDLMSTSQPQQISSSLPRQSSASKINHGTTKPDTCHYKPYENPPGSSLATNHQMFSQPTINQAIQPTHPQSYTNLLPSFNPKTVVPSLPPSDPSSRQQKQSKSVKQTKSGDQSSRSQPGPSRSYRTLSDSVVDITRKSSETWSSSSYRYYDAGYSAGSAQSFVPNASSSNSYNDSNINRRPVSHAPSNTRHSESTAAPKFNKTSDKPKSGNTRGAKASATSGRRASAQSSQQMQLAPPPSPLRPSELGSQNAHLLQLRPPPALHQPSEGFMDMGNNCRNSFGYFESVPNRVQFGADTTPLPQPINQLVDKSRIGFEFGDRNLMQNTFQQQHSAHDIKAKQTSSQSRQSSSKNFHPENTSTATMNPSASSSSSYSNQSHQSSNKKKSTEPLNISMQHPSSQPTGQQHSQHNQFQGSYNQSSNMWVYDQPQPAKASSMRSNGGQNQPSYQKTANAFSVSKLVGNVESQQQQQQPRHFVEGLLGKNTPTLTPWVPTSGVDVHHSTNVSDQGFGYYQQPEGQIEYFNYNPTYHQPSPQVTNNSQLFSTDQGNHTGQSNHGKSNSHPEIVHYPSYPSSSNQQQQQHDRSRQTNEVQQYPRFQPQHHPATKIEQHSAPENQSSSHQQMQQQQHHAGTSSVSNFNLSSIFPEVNQDIGNRPQQHQQHLNLQSHANSHQRSTSGHFYR